MRFPGLIAALHFTMPMTVSLAQTQRAGPAIAAGTGRILRETAKDREPGLGRRAKMNYRIDPDALPADDKECLTKMYKPGGRTPCIATVNGTEVDDPLQVRATKIKWHN